MHFKHIQKVVLRKISRYYRTLRLKKLGTRSDPHWSYQLLSQLPTLPFGQKVNCDLVPPSRFIKNKITDNNISKEINLSLNNIYEVSICSDELSSSRSNALHLDISTLMDSVTRTSGVKPTADSTEKMK